MTESDLIDMMRDVARDRDKMIDALSRLSRYARKFPDMRIGDDLVVREIDDALKQQ